MQKEPRAHLVPLDQMDLLVLSGQLANPDYLVLMENLVTMENLVKMDPTDCL